MHYQQSKTFPYYIKSYPITFLIVFIHLCFYILMWIPLIPHQFIYKEFIGVNLYISEGEIWRLFTPIFIHIHFAHFFYNTLSIAIMGPFLETLLGKLKFILLYILSGFAGNAASFIFLPLTYTHAGSSGAILGLLGCFFLFVITKKLYLSKQNQNILLLIIGISACMSVLGTDINITAHIAGLFTGLLCGWLFSRTK